MATFAKTDAFKTGNRRCVSGTLTLGTYATGGESIAASVFGLKKVTGLTHGAFTKSDFTNAVVGRYVHSTNKLVLARQKDPADTGGADIALPEVANSVDMSAYSTHVVAVGW